MHEITERAIRISLNVRVGPSAKTVQSRCLRLEFRLQQKKKKRLMIQYIRYLFIFLRVNRVFSNLMTRAQGFR